jgi:hypothetical protein
VYISDNIHQENKKALAGTSMGKEVFQMVRTETSAGGLLPATSLGALAGLLAVK